MKRKPDPKRAERLKQARRAAGYSSALQAAEAFGWKYGTYNTHENASRGFDPELAKTYGAAFGVDPQWLLFGKGKGPAGSLAVVAEQPREYGQPQTKGSVGVFDIQIAAGDGVYIDVAHRTGEIEFDRAWLRSLTNSPPSKLKIVQLKGDSMDPTVPDGAWIMVDTADKKLVSNKIYVFAEEDEGRVKRISMHPQTKKLTLISDNPSWPNIEDVDPSRLDILGRVIWYSRKV